MSGGLDSQLAIRVLQRAGAEVEAVCFSTPFFDLSAAKKAAENASRQSRVLPPCGSTCSSPTVKEVVAQRGMAKNGPMVR